MPVEVVSAAEFPSTSLPEVFWRRRTVLTNSRVALTAMRRTLGRILEQMGPGRPELLGSGDGRPLKRRAKRARQVPHHYAALPPSTPLQHTPSTFPFCGPSLLNRLEIFTHSLKFFLLLRTCFV